MPLNKNAMTRYALIDRLLANRHKAYSIQDITDRINLELGELGYCPVSKRCIEKDINYLEYDSPFDAELEEYWVDATDKNDRVYRKRCLRYVDPTFSIFKPKLTYNEKLVLSTSLEMLGSMEGIESFEWINDMCESFKIETPRRIIHFSKNLISDYDLFGRLFSAIRLNQVLNLIYHPYSKSEGESVAVTPFLLKEYNNRWFLIAGACDTGKILTFALDRIEDFSENHTYKRVDIPDNLDDRYDDIIGVTYFEDTPLLEITFWVSDNSKGFVMSKPLHGSQTQIRGETEL
ncbi:MAG: WYL domain-containing protein [Muribaculaceae bacterium]|nr:WYL domain-containing protein [Muribaculaceae bacterium]